MHVLNICTIPAIPERGNKKAGSHNVNTADGQVSPEDQMLQRACSLQTSLMNPVIPYIPMLRNC